MSWARLDDHANEHRKQLDAGAEACWLWACGLMYANRQAARDGFIPDRIVGMLYPVKNPKKLAEKLVKVGLWLRADGGFLIHEFTEWNQSKDERDTYRAAGRARAAESYTRKKTQAYEISSREENAKTPSEEKAKNPNSSPRRTSEENAILHNSSGSTPLHSNPEEKKIPPPPSEPDPRPDPMLASLQGRRTQDAPEVVAVFDAWRMAHGFTGAKFRQPADIRADILHEAIATHGVAQCLRVVEASKADAMVTGKADERGQEHRSVEYIFKPTTFDRLLRAADEAERKKSKSVAELTRRARAL